MFIMIPSITLIVILLGFIIFLFISHPIKYKNYINQQCSNLNLNSALVASLINVESSYNKNAKSNKNAIGLMQLKLSTAQYVNNYYKLNLVISEQALYIPYVNIHLGCLYLKYLQQKFTNPETYLAAYNAGETKVNEWLKLKEYSLDGKTLNKIPYTETANYVKKVKSNINFYNFIYK